MGVALGAAAIGAVGAIGSAGLSFAGASKAGKDASKLQKRAIAMQRQAADLISGRLGESLELPRLDLSDLVFNPAQIETLSQSLRQASTEEQFNAALQEIGRTFFPDALTASRVDIENALRILPAAQEASAQINQAEGQLRSDALEAFAPGTAERRRATLEGLNAFLNFDVPDRLDQELRRRSVEQAYRTGQISGPVASRAADRLTYDTLTNNFFRAAETGQREQAITSSQVGETGLRFAPASTLELELANLQRRTQADLLNFQNMVNQRLTNFGAQTDEVRSNLERRDQITGAQANLLIGQGNAFTQQASALSQIAANQFNQGVQSFGQAIGQIDFGSLTRGVTSLFTNNRQPANTAAVPYNPNLPVYKAELA